MSIEYSAFAPPSLATAAPAPNTTPRLAPQRELEPLQRAQLLIDDAPVEQPSAPLFTPTPLPPFPPPPMPRKRSGWLNMYNLLGVALLAGGSLLAYKAFTGSEEAASETPEFRVEAPEPASPLLIPIEDSKNVVDEINDRAEEVALLEALGLDPTGRPIPPGYRFIATSASGASLSVQVDSTTGDYSLESPDGFAFRSIDGATVSRSAATDAWTPVDASQATSRQNFGVERLVGETDIVTAAIGPWISVVERTFFDGIESTTYLLDVAAIQAEQPGLAETWGAGFGLSPDAVVSGASAPVTIVVVVDAQRTVQAFTIEASGLNGTVTYRLEAVYEQAPAIRL